MKYTTTIHQITNILHIYFRIVLYSRIKYSTTFHKIRNILHDYFRIVLYSKLEIYHHYSSNNEYFTHLFETSFIFKKLNIAPLFIK